MTLIKHQTLSKPPTSKGFVILFSIMMTSAVLVLAGAVANLVFKEALLVSSSRDSHYAFYAADGGSECALYWDLKKQHFPIGASAVGNITCNNETFGVSQYGNIFFFTYKTAGIGESYCANVEVDKSNPARVEVRSRGFNTCDFASKRRVERALRVRYANASIPNQPTDCLLDPELGSIIVPISSDGNLRANELQSVGSHQTSLYALPNSLERGLSYSISVHTADSRPESSAQVEEQAYFELWGSGNLLARSAYPTRDVPDNYPYSNPVEENVISEVGPMSIMSNHQTFRLSHFKGYGSLDGPNSFRVVCVRFMPLAE
jgi:hypothetical protein